MVYYLFKNNSNRNRLGNTNPSVLQIFKCADFFDAGPKSCSLSPREENMFYEVVARKKKIRNELARSHGGCQYQDKNQH